MTQTLHIITGATAVGKTDYALSYAEAHNAEIVSCDASLFYRGMDIGTAKPTAAEMARVPHHLIDICEVNQPYDIVTYVEDARRAIEEITSRGKSVVVTGGSGFYLKSFLAPVIDTLVVPDEVRQKVTTLFEEEGLEALQRQLQQLNPGGVANLDVKNPRRLMRALERCIVSGKTLSELQAEFAARPRPYADFAKKVILLEREKEELNERIKLRVELMMRQGLIEEVRRLRDRGIEENSSAASAIGYRETLACLKGELDRDALVPAIVQNTTRLAKKQRTWFRTQITVDERIRF
ncbi:tRNA (adenosine(37)-N6)-dimethylallyltransferase MiaA [Coraliomargarita sinensis]|uniref:tRNA (adenosine(37)-N6)-dimethylallyltransferase MiaA n=1 Tax=Coraliomargarita sinensis TaxID=2174842 RepID=UPI0018EE6AC2|nr:tRNA (adenosine(37)-N6)-dimethylallyltransferase MiaA [Coraliomargarita sinensis]